MSWKDIIKAKKKDKSESDEEFRRRHGITPPEERVPGVNYEAGENLARELERRRGENEKRWKDQESRTVFSGNGGRDGQDPDDVIKENDPELYQKLENHFQANPLDAKSWFGSEYDGSQELVDIEGQEIEAFHWTNAFLKYGFEDGEYEFFTEEVKEFIESLGYQVWLTDAVSHNLYINTVLKN